METNRFKKIIDSLRKLSKETEWVEFKVNNSKPENIGEYISALSNSAALCNEPTAFLVWGVENETHKLVGTNFKPHKEKIGNQELELWLSISLLPHIDFKFHENKVNGKEVVLLEIPAARHTPVRFRENEFIRVGSIKKKLKDFPEKESALWNLFQEYRFEQDIALSDVSVDEVLRLIDYPAYFYLTETPLPANKTAIINRLIEERMLIQRFNGQIDVTNLGAILFAKDLKKFERLAKKSLRIIQYKGKNRVETVREFPNISQESKGYALGFEAAIGFIDSILPLNEQIGKAFREEVRMYPAIAVRELVANAIIHQDFSITGASPKVEIFSDRIEITNPGKPLIDTLRFIDSPPRSRNEDIAAFMRRINLCEERGSGIDKVIQLVELFELPPPDFRIVEDNTIAVLFALKKLNDMTKKERIRACYQHACLQFVTNEEMTNSSVRKRFGIEPQNYSTASRIIAETIKADFVKPSDPTNKSRKHSSYIPFWA
ncbi:MAG: ATP-binding protein [Aridibacter sp.]